VYAVSNQWVHLSERHIFNAWQKGDGRTLLGQSPMPADAIPVRFWQELIGAMSRATGSLLALGSSWAAYEVSDDHAANDEHAANVASPTQSESDAGLDP
jgi:hypothetical protein